MLNSVYDESMPLKIENWGQRASAALLHNAHCFLRLSLSFFLSALRNDRIDMI